MRLLRIVGIFLRLKWREIWEPVSEFFSYFTGSAMEMFMGLVVISCGFFAVGAIVASVTHGKIAFIFFIGLFGLGLWTAIGASVLLFKFIRWLRSNWREAKREYNIQQGRKSIDEYKEYKRKRGLPGRKSRGIISYILGRNND